jgi:H+/Cl- antiporter ClcA
MARIPKRVTGEVMEEVVLFTSVVKWFIISSCIGVIVGFSTTIFLKALQLGSDYAGGYDYYFLLLPFSLFLSSFVIKYLAPDAVGHGTEKVIEAVHQRSGRIKAAVVPVKLIATVMTIATGGSAGKEGPCAQIGAGLSSGLASLLKFDENDRKKLVICGISAGFSTVFGTPIAGAIFGIEVLVIGSLFYDALFPSFVAGMIGFQVAHALGITYIYHPIEFVPVFSGSFIIEVVLAGAFLGFCSFLFIEILYLFKMLSAKRKVWEPLKGLIGGGILVVLTLIFSQQFLGLGLDTIKGVLEGESVGWHVFLMKMIFTSITLNFGGSGGIVTPIFFVGSAAGSFFGDILGMDRATFAALGLVGLLSGAANTPIAASIMSVELFGPQIAPYAAIVCIISYLMTGHRSVFPSQILLKSKSASVIVDPGTVIDDIKEVHIKARSRTLFGIILKILEAISNFINKIYMWAYKKYKSK